MVHVAWSTTIGNTVPAGLFFARLASRTKPRADPTEGEPNRAATKRERVLIREGAGSNSCPRSHVGVADQCENPLPYGRGSDRCFKCDGRRYLSRSSGCLPILLGFIDDLLLHVSRYGIVVGELDAIAALPPGDA